MLRPTWPASLVVRPRSCLVPQIRRYASLPPSQSTSLLQKSKTAAKITGFLCLSSALGIVVVGTGILAHDAFTYNDRHVNRVPVNPLALHPDHGGPNNLPIARVLIDDEEDEEAQLLAAKPKLVIVGGGWGVRGIRCSCSLYSMTSAGHGCPSDTSSRRLPCHSRFF